MTVPSEDLRIAADFPPATLAEWRKLALGVLRKSGVAGEDTPADAVDALLAKTTYDGIAVAPLYTAAAETSPAGVPGAPPFTRGGRAAGPVLTGWEIRQRHADPDPAASRAALAADLAGGVTSLWLTLGAGGLDPAALAEVLADVPLDSVSVVLDAGDRAADAARGYLALLADRGVDPAAVRGGLGADPLGWQARTGAPAELAVVGELALRCAKDFPGLRAVTVDATAYHDAGGADAEELGCALATGVAYLRELASAGLDTATALGQLEFRFAATADQFLTLAKLRAARRCWARVAQECGAPEAGAQYQHAVTSAAMMSARDPWVNMLRTTLACFGAGVGGADAVTVAPFDAALGLPDAFSRRIARNTQVLLLEESHLGRVIDPAGGSWYVEQLTEQLAQAAWAWFTEIEKAGGIAAALGSGLVAERLDATWQSRVVNIAHRRDPLTGVSEFPNLAEQLPVRPAAPAVPAGGLPRHRYAEVFEALRDRADAHAASTGAAPTVFLATLGPLAVHSARATFAANLLAAGGIATVDGGVGTDPQQVAEAFKASGATVACLCSSDKVYAASAADTAQALKAAGAAQVWLAGKPGDFPGVDSYLFMGCDARGVAEAILAQLGVA